MPLSVFPSNPPPEFPIQRRASYAISETQFGDGYRLVRPDGINTRTDTVSLTWRTLTAAEKNVIYNFLTGAAPATPFVYNGHDGVNGVYTCKEWDVQQVSPLHWDMSAVFVQFHGY